MTGATVPTPTNDASAFMGYWKITQMEVWALDYFDLVVPGFIEFRYEETQVMGTFQFGTVAGWLDCRLRDMDGVTHLEWSWQGQSDSDPGCGRGWAALVNDALVGRVFIHSGDDSAFTATKRPRPAERPTRARRRSEPSTASRYH